MGRLESRRLLAGAVLDTTFLDDGGGWPFRADELIERVQPLAGGKILAVGQTSRSTPQSPDLLFVRLNADGRRDASFGDDGRIVRALAGGTLLNIDVNSRGQTAAALRTPDDALIVRRFTAGGAVDRSFDGDGKFTNALTRGAADALGHRAAIEIDLTENGSVGVFFRKDALFHVARFLPDGRRDAGFGTRGLISFEDSDGQTGRDRVNDAAIGDDGRVLLGGSTPTFTDLRTQSFWIVDRTGRQITDAGLQLTGEDDTHIARVALRPGDGAAFGVGDYFGENWPVSNATDTRFESDDGILDGLPNLGREVRLSNIAFGSDGHVYFAGGS